MFPKSDPVINPSWAVDTRTLPEKFLSIMCTSLGLLNSLELEHWNTICGRNCLFKEKSKAGIYATDYDIKTEQRNFKKEMARLNYIDTLGNKTSPNSRKNDHQLNFNSLEEQVFYNPLSSIDKIKIQSVSENNLLLVYQDNPNILIGYLNLARSLNISKARKKKLNKFRTEIYRKKIPAFWPLKERLCQLAKALRQEEKIDNTVEINLIKKDTSNLPFVNIILSNKRQNRDEGIPLQETLIDTGSEINILTLQMLKDFKIPENLIQKLEHSLNVITSNGISKDCILGTLNADIYVVINDKEKSLHKCKNNLFFVAGPEIILKTPILGTNFLKKHKVAINYSATEKCNITAETRDQYQVIAYRPLMVNDPDRILNFHNVAEINNIGVGQHLFQHSSIIYKDQSGTFQNQDKFIMPQDHFIIQGTPIARFYEQHGELQPILLQHDHVEVNLPPEVKAEQVVLKFHRSDEAVAPKVSRQEIPQFQVESSNSSEPIINIQIAEVDTKSNIPESKVSLQEIPQFQVDSSNTSEPIINVQITAVDTEANIPEHNLSTASFLNRLEQIANTHPGEVIENPNTMASTEISVLTLKIKEKLKEDIIDDLEEQIYNRLDKQNIFLEHPGDSINIDHLDQETKDQLTKIVTNYDNSFAKDNYDCGSYIGVVVHLDVQDNKTAFQRE